ncbi:MAG: ABC transporter substrate-binding protein [bacterium]|nr:ABC transporter substrate-binding protein [bacterium]
MNRKFLNIPTRKLLAGMAALLICLAAVPFASAQYIADDGWKEFGKSYWPEGPVRGGIYKTAFVKYVGMLNPNHWPVNDFATLNNIYERQVLRDGQYQSSIPFLAESWQFITPVVVVSKLRQGVKFHDGSELTAHTVKYQIDWVLDRKNGCWTRSYLSLLKSVEVVDEYTLKCHLKKPWAVFASGVLAGFPGRPISARALKNDVKLRELSRIKGRIFRAQKKVAKAQKKVEKAPSSKKGKARKKLQSAQKKAAKLEKQLEKLKKTTAGTVSTDRHGVGTGPFMVEEGRPGNYLLLKRNPNWWFARHVGRPEMPYFDKMQVMVIPDPAIQLANLRAGRIHAMNINKSMVHMVKNECKFTIHSFPFNGMAGLRFNLAKGSTQDIRIRKAVSHAIDRKAIIAGTQFGMARIASAMFPEDHWCHNPDLEPVAYNPELSKKLLAEAGHPDGLTLKGFAVNHAEASNLSVAVRGMLKKVGINWKVDMLDTAAATSRMRNLEYELSVGGYNWIWDSDLMVTNLYHPDGGFNSGRSNNAEAIKLIEAGKIEVKDEKRQKIYQKLEEVLYNNYEDVWLYWQVIVVAYNKKVQGWNNDMFLKYREGYQFTHPLWFKNGK